MFQKVLIANRGEIACRIIKTAHAMGIQTVAVFSKADGHALHVKLADHSVCIGPAPSDESYLKIDTIIKAALQCGADAIHPGYGFLSENADFCNQCIKNNIVFIGPSATSISAMGSKSRAKALMIESGVPTIPGYHGDQQDLKTLKSEAQKLGYPILIKAVAGGGGKGMRLVGSESDFEQALTAVKREALNSFNDKVVLLERYLLKPRHVEIQVFCDNHNNGVYLFERDCSIQRRHQKVIEEAPAPGISDDLRQRMGNAAVKAAQAINYTGAGTVEFLLDGYGDFFFMEMNTRLQVEHPITEMITGQDLVEWQFLVAADNPLPQSQDQLHINGHAFEARIYAEDPDNGFLPATGLITDLQLPTLSDHVRLDTGVIEGDKITMHYDPMIAKLIVWDINRNRALVRLTKALSDYRIRGIKTNVGFLYNVATSKAFKEANLDIQFIEQHSDEVFRLRKTDTDYAAPIAASVVLKLRQQRASLSAKKSPEPNSPWHLGTGWGMPTPNLRLRLQANEVVAKSDTQSDMSGVVFGISDKGIDVFTPKGYFNCREIKPSFGIDQEQALNQSTIAPMSGTIVSLTVELGAEVRRGDTLVVMEAMKMEHTISANSDGVITEFYCQPGDTVDGGSELFAFEVSIK